MTRINMEVDGARQLQKQLKSISPTLRRKAYRGGLMRASRWVRAVAMRIVRRRTGRLQKNIRYKVRVSSKHNDAVLGVTEKAFYGSFVERGTSHHRAYPFLKPALTSQARRVVQIYGKEVNKVLTDIERRG